MLNASDENRIRNFDEIMILNCCMELLNRKQIFRSRHYLEFYITQKPNSNGWIFAILRTCLLIAATPTSTHGRSQPLNQEEATSSSLPLLPSALLTRSGSSSGNFFKTFRSIAMGDFCAFSRDRLVFNRPVYLVCRFSLIDLNYISIYPVANGMVPVSQDLEVGQRGIGEGSR